MTTVNGISGGNVFNNNRSERTGASGTKNPMYLKKLKKRKPIQ